MKILDEILFRLAYPDFEFFERLKQCVFCANDPQTCGCDDSDEDENRMCKKYKERGGKE